MTAERTISRAFLRSVLRKRAVDDWRREIERSRGKRPYQIPRREEIPRIPRALQGIPKELATRFFQLASGHAMIAPFLREKFGWVESDSCWWCSGGRQSCEHLFKECRTWMEEIKTLWKTLGDISGVLRDRPGGVYKGRKGFLVGTTGGRVGPGNCSVRRLFGDPRFSEAILKFLADMRVGKIKKGVIVRGEAAD